MVPDKIYLYPYSTDGIYEVETRPSGDTIEYIRKDALLEWLKKKESQCMPESMAQIYFKMFIDKLNSM